MSRIKYFVCTLILQFLVINAQQIKYLNGLEEFEICKFDETIFGICRRITDCLKEFELYQRNQTILKICSFGETVQNDVICCSKEHEGSKIDETESTLENRFRMIEKRKDQSVDLLDFKTCRKTLLKYRKTSINPNNYAKAMDRGIIPTNKETCKQLDRLNKMMTENFWDLTYYHCIEQNGKYHVIGVAALYATLVERGDRPNMAAIGWTQKDYSIRYECGGSIVTERFIVTAAHCKYFEGAEADTVRLGDRFLVTTDDDDIAQQHEIEKFITHPDYKSTYHYNDIAMIKTVKNIIFDKFVVPSCIDDLDSERIGVFTHWTVAGYGETEDRVPANVLLELKVDHASYDECNKTYQYDTTLPKGIHNSQFCVKSKKIGNLTPDTCFGDSGSPLQFKSAHEVFHDDFETTFLSTVYEVSTVLGIVSFGLDCGFAVPSVYTKLEYHKNWMRAVIKYY